MSPNRCRHRRRATRLGNEGVRTRRLRRRRRQLPRGARRSARVVCARGGLHRIGQQDVAVLRAQCAGCSAAVGGGVEAVSTARRRRDRAAHLRHRPAAHRHHCAAPAAERRPSASGPGAVVGRVSAAAPAARNLVGEPGFPAARRAVHQGAQREPGLHRAALHDRRRRRGVLAAAAPVAALGVLRDAGAHARPTRGGWPSRTGRGRISGTARTFS